LELAVLGVCGRKTAWTAVGAWACRDDRNGCAAAPASPDARGGFWDRRLALFLTLSHRKPIEVCRDRDPQALRERPARRGLERPVQRRLQSRARLHQIQGAAGVLRGGC